MLEQVRPVERPLLATGMPTVGATVSPAGAPEPPSAPSPRMPPEVSTVPGTIRAIAASTLLLFSAGACEKFATVWALLAVHETSTRPGWMIGSPDLAAPEIAM